MTTAGNVSFTGVFTVTIGATTTLKLNSGTASQLLTTDASKNVVTTSTPILGTPASGTLSNCDAATSTAKGVTTSYFPTVQSSVKIVGANNYRVTQNDGYQVIVVDDTGADRTITLPAGNVSAGRCITMIKSGSGGGAAKFSSAGSETLNGYTLSGGGYLLSSRYSTVTVCGDGTNWFTVHTAGDTIRSYTSVSGTANTVVNVTSFAVPAGVWLLSAIVAADGASGSTELLGSISASSASLTGIGSDYGDSTAANLNTSSLACSVSIPNVLYTSTNTTLYLNAKAVGATTTISGRIMGIRIK